MSDPRPAPLTARDWHVLVALSDEDLHGYGIMKAVERDSGGRVSAEIGSLYRVLDRLTTEGWVREVDDPEDAPAGTRGRPRRYYGLTPRGREAVRQEALRLRAALALAEERDLLGGATP